MPTNPRGNSRTQRAFVQLQQQMGSDNAVAVDNLIRACVDEEVNPLAKRLEVLEAGTPGRAAASRAVRAAEADPTPANEAAAEQAVAEAEGNVTSVPLAASPPPAGASPVAPDGQTLAGAHARLDQLEACVGEVQVVSATAYASVRADGDAAWHRAARWALGALVVTLVLYGLVVLVDDQSWSWRWAIGLPAVVAGVVAAIVFVTSREDGPAASVVASADAIVARWEASPVSQPQAPQQQGTQVRAGAHASTR